MKITRLFLSALAAVALIVTTAQADSLHKGPMPRPGRPAVHAPMPPHHPAPLPAPAHHHKALHGNTLSKIYHASDCEFYNGRGHMVEFASARQAEAAGFRACKICEGREGVAPHKNFRKASSRHLHGNPGSKTLHGPSCKFYNAKSSSERFASFDQARRHGYHLCPICKGK